MANGLPAGDFPEKMAAAYPSLGEQALAFVHRLDALDALRESRRR